jgi:hypothetical protein
MNKADFQALPIEAKSAYWRDANKQQRLALQDLSGLHAPFIGLEGCRVEVSERSGYKRRFIIGRSTGWKPCHLEIARRNSSGGGALYVDFDSFKIVRYA